MLLDNVFYILSLPARHLFRYVFLISAADCSLVLEHYISDCATFFLSIIDCIVASLYVTGASYSGIQTVSANNQSFLFAVGNLQRTPFTALKKCATLISRTEHDQFPSSYN